MTGRAHRNALQPGYKLHWYEIKSILGQGGFGITYLAHDLNLDREVAIKEYLPTEFAVREGDFSVHAASDDTSPRFKWGLERFIQEARTLSRFEHPNIVRVHAVFEENNTGYMVMPYEKGHSLQTILSKKKTLNQSTLLHMLEPLLDGLKLIHQAGFIHRDIKPDNIFIREDGSPVLLDFGSARQAVAGDNKTLTTLVSPGYAPFEQYYSRSDEQGPWTDIYGLGATLYRAISGRAPMDAVERSKSVLEGTRDHFVPATDIGRGTYSDEFLNAIDHAISFKQAERPQTVGEWQSEIIFSQDNIATELATDFDKINDLPKTAEVMKKSSSAKPVMLIVIVLLLLAGGGYFYLAADSQSPVAENTVVTPIVNPVVETSDDTPAEENRDSVETTPVMADNNAEEAGKLAEEQRRAAAEAAAAEAEKVARAAELEIQLEAEREQQLEEEKRAQATRELEAERQRLAEQRRLLEEDIARKQEQERLAEVEKQRQAEEARRLAESKRVEQERQRLALERQRLAEEKAALEAQRREDAAREEQRLQAERDRQQQIEEQRLEEEAERRRQLEIEKRIAASRLDFAPRLAVKADKHPFLDNVSAQDLETVRGNQVSVPVRSELDKWQNSGVAIQRGSTYRITASGTWHLGGLCGITDATGEGLYNVTCWDLGNQTVAGRSHAALIGKIGQQALAFYIGTEFTFTADKDGTLYMMSNDAPAFFFDNSGELTVTIKLID